MKRIRNNSQNSNSNSKVVMLDGPACYNIDRTLSTTSIYGLKPLTTQQIVLYRPGGAIHIYKSGETFQPDLKLQYPPIDDIS